MPDTLRNLPENPNNLSAVAFYLSAAAAGNMETVMQVEFGQVTLMINDIILTEI